MRPNSGRAALLALLGAKPDATAATASHAYLGRRRDLLAQDPDWRRPEVARLDDAFDRLRAAADLERRLAGHRPVRVRIGIGDATVLVAPSAPGSTAGDFPFPDVERVHVLTAFNPRSRPLRPHENASRQRALADRLAASGLPSWPAVCADARHTELTIAVAGLTRAGAQALGAEFEQDAIVEWTRAAWWLVPCDELVTPWEFGWRAALVAAPLADPLTARHRSEAAASDADAASAAEAAEAAAIARARDRAGDTSPAVAGPAASAGQLDTPAAGPASPAGVTPPADTAMTSQPDEPTSTRPASAAKGDTSAAPREHGGGGD